MQKLYALFSIFIHLAAGSLSRALVSQPERIYYLMFTNSNNLPCRDVYSVDFFAHFHSRFIFAILPKRNAYLMPNQSACRDVHFVQIPMATQNGATPPSTNQVDRPGNVGT